MSKRRYVYTVYVGIISGEVEADSRDDALTAAVEDARAQADECVADGTWTLTPVDSDD